ADVEQFRRALIESGRQQLTIGVCLESGGRNILLRLKPTVPPDLDVIVLHRLAIEQCIGISEEAIKKESHIAYVREFDSALAAVRNRTAQVSFLLNSTRL